MPNTSKAKIIALVIMAITVLLVAFFIVKENFALSQEGKIISRASITDTDGDGLTDEEETKYKTNPNQADSDGDGVSDLEEIQKGTDPNKADQIPGDVDSDGDGLTNDEEAKYGTDPFNPDTDQDGYSDGQEIVSGYDPLTPCEGCEGRVAGDWSKTLEGLTEGLEADKILENVDTSPVELPDISDSELNITDETGKKAMRKYFDEVEKVLKKDLPFVMGKENIQAFASDALLILQNKEKIDEITKQLETTYQDIKNIPTPKECKTIKTKTLQILKVSPQILNTIYDCQQRGDYLSYLSQLYKIQSLSLVGGDLAKEITNIQK